MGDVLSLREASVVEQTIEQLEEQLRRSELVAQDAEERAERLAADVERLEVDLRAKRRHIADLTSARNKKRENSPRKDEIESVFRAWYEAICAINPRRKTATLGERRWKVIDDALRKGFDRDTLAAAAAGIAHHPYEIDGRRYDELHIALKDEVRIEQFARLGDQPEEEPAPAAPATTPAISPGDVVRAMHPSALDRAVATLRREFGAEAVEHVHDVVTHHYYKAEWWSVCPLHPTSYTRMPDMIHRPLRLRPGRGGCVEAACSHSCPPTAIEAEIRELERRQEDRKSNVVELRRRDAA